MRGQPGGGMVAQGTGHRSVIAGSGRDDVTDQPLLAGASSRASTAAARTEGAR